MFKIVHEKYKKKGHAGEAAAEEFLHSFQFAIETNKEVASLVNKVQVGLELIKFYFVEQE